MRRAAAAEALSTLADAYATYARRSVAVRGRAVVEALREERFLVLPHPEVLEMWRRKTSDYDRWLRGMRRLQAHIEEATRQ